MNLFKGTLYILITSLFIAFGFNQSKAQFSDEEIILSFKTEQGQSIYFFKQKKTETIIFKIEKGKKIELQFPENSNKKEAVFMYSYYLRGGGQANEGMDLNYVYFVYHNSKYVLYETSYDSDQKSNIGLKIINLQTSEMVEYKAVKGTSNGTLLSLRDSNMVIKGDELFD
jgi:hypothetical protein